MEPNIKQRSVELITQNLRERSQNDGVMPERIVAALARVGDIWESRLAPGSDWTPPDGSPFPWAQVRISLAGLIPGLKAAGEWLAKASPHPRLLSKRPSPLGRGEGEPEMLAGLSERENLSPQAPPLPFRGERGQGGEGLTAALILAGNTPLMSWSPMCACLLAGWSIFVKMSRDETLWPRLLVESLTEADGEVAARVHLDVWPGEDERTTDLCRAADAVIAFGSDDTINALRAVTPEKTAFFGFGHSVSVGLFLRNRFDGEGHGNDDFRGFARDILLYAQSGCLSPQVILVQGGAHTVGIVSIALMEQLPYQADELQVMAVTDVAVARRLREAEALATMGGWSIFSDDFLRWTVARTYKEIPLPKSVGFGFIWLLPWGEDFSSFLGYLQSLSGGISCVGVAGELLEEQRAAILAEDVSRICRAGEMQSPPLDWPNGNVDLLTGLIRVSQSIGQTVAERR